MTVVLLSWLLFDCLAPCISAAPASSTTSSIPPSEPVDKSWVSEPDGRGTFSIIFSCLTTLLFCASKILKPNILDPRWGSRVIQIIQVLAGMFVPELVYLVALGQYLDARGVRDTINRKAMAFAGEQNVTEDMRRESGFMKCFWRWLFFAHEPQYIEMVHASPKSYLVITTPFDKLTLGFARALAFREMDPCTWLLCNHGWIPTRYLQIRFTEAG